MLVCLYAGPFDVCRQTHCGECSKGAPGCNAGEQSQGTSTCSNNCWFSRARERKCCAQSTCATNNDAYASVFEDVPYTMAVLSNDDGKAGLSISSKCGHLLDPANALLSEGFVWPGVSTPSRGSAVKSGQSIIYTPGADFHGSDSFQYCARDGTTTGQGCSVMSLAADNDLVCQPQCLLRCQTYFSWSRLPCPPDGHCHGEPCQ